MDYMYFTSATVANAGEIALKWQWDTDVDLGEIRLMRGDRPESLVELLSFNRAVSLNNSFSELNLNTADQAYYYQLKSTDACGFEVNSSIVRTLLLKGRAIEDLVNVLAWEAPLLGDAKVLNYELFRTDERGVTRVGEIPPGQLTFEDKMELRRFGRAEACYHLIANLSLEQADGTQLEIVLQSNDFCLKQKSVIQIPNAFAPNSQKVNFFRPLIAFESSVSDYSMQIFDRNAGLLFKTEDLHEGWEGNSISGRFIQQGVYVYLIRFTQADGTPVVKKGTVTLLR